MSPFETILLEEVAKLKSELARADESLSGFDLTIHASGRLDGDVEVSFSLGDYYAGGSCRAGSLGATLQEFLRRRNWIARNAPLCLPNVSPASSQAAGDEIPF